MVCRSVIVRFYSLHYILCSSWVIGDNVAGDFTIRTISRLSPDSFRILKRPSNFEIAHLATVCPRRQLGHGPGKFTGIAPADATIEGLSSRSHIAGASGGASVCLSEFLCWNLIVKCTRNNGIHLILSSTTISTVIITETDSNPNLKPNHNRNPKPWTLTLLIVTLVRRYAT